jgi:hypothetical protein
VCLGRITNAYEELYDILWLANQIYLYLSY